MKKTFLLLAFTILSLAALHADEASQEATSDPNIVIVTKDGLKPVTLKNGHLPKNSNETFYLKSAIETKDDHPVKPKPSAKPVKNSKVSSSQKNLESDPAPTPKKAKSNAEKKSKKQQSEPEATPAPEATL